MPRPLDSPATNGSALVQLLLQSRGPEGLVLAVEFRPEDAGLLPRFWTLPVARRQAGHYEFIPQGADGQSLWSLAAASPSHVDSVSTVPFTGEHWPNALWMDTFLENEPFQPLEQSVSPDCPYSWQSVQGLFDSWTRGQAYLAPPLPDVLQALLASQSVLSEVSPLPLQTTVFEPVQGVVIFPLRTPTLPPATQTNCYLLGTREFFVVEPASPDPEEQERLWVYIQERIEAGERPVAIVLTHHHPDHIGGIRHLQEKLDLPLWAHRETAKRLPPELKVVRFLEEGEQLRLLDGVEAEATERVFEIFHTPGHAPGHLCFLDQKTGFLVAGDMIAGEGTILIEPHDGNMIQYLESLARLRELGTRALLPAHGPPQVHPRRLLQGYIDHRLAREGKVLQALESGLPLPLQDLVPRVYADVPPLLYPLASLSLQAHLDKLVHEGRVQETAGQFRLQHQLPSGEESQGAGAHE